jgi:hypothetical protein
MTRVLYREWFPQIVFDHHQTAPAGTVMFAPPFRGPLNPVFDPLVPVAIELVGAAIHARLAAEDKPGATMRNGSNYTMWWNGGLRTSAYFHNQIGLLTETIGDPTPIAIPFVADRQLPTADLPFPVAPQPWRFRQSIEYEVTANRAVLDMASRFRETFLLNAYRMARNSIDRGSRDTWTAGPQRLGLRTGRRAGAAGPRAADAAPLRDPALRDARGYVLPSDQPDFPTATKFVEALLRTGVAVHRAAAPFTAAGRTYPAGSFVVRTAQAFRPHVLDMFEPQDHPDDFPSPDGPPRPPYDNAGWTLAYQMGVKFDRMLDDFAGPFEPVSHAAPPPARVAGAARPAGYLLRHHQNDAAIAVNRLLAAGADVYWLNDRTIGGTAGGTGSILVPASETATAIVTRAANELGISVTGVAAMPEGEALRLRSARIGLWDGYGGSSPSGWARWLLERFEFPHEVVYVQALDEGRLRDRFDVILLTDEALGSNDPGIPVDAVPPAYRHMLGRITPERTVPQLRRFSEEGGTLVAIGSATAIGERMGLPVTSALTVRDAAGRARPLQPAEFSVPGSVMRVQVDNTTPLGFGFEPEVDVFFDASPVFALRADADRPGVRRVAWFASATPLRSGWAWGQHHLQGGAAIVDVPLGRGRVLLFGPEIVYRGQPHGTFKFLFNAVHASRAEPVRLGAAGTR